MSRFLLLAGRVTTVQHDKWYWIRPIVIAFMKPKPNWHILHNFVNGVVASGEIVSTLLSLYSIMNLKKRRKRVREKSHLIIWKSWERFSWMPYNGFKSRIIYFSKQANVSDALQMPLSDYHTCNSFISNSLFMCYQN